jgi:hypothetical protein
VCVFVCVWVFCVCVSKTKEDVDSNREVNNRTAYLVPIRSGKILYCIVRIVIYSDARHGRASFA